MTKREKGVETASCPNCGTDRPLAEQADGSYAAESCTKCFPAPKPQKASTSVKREQGSQKKED